MASVNRHLVLVVLSALLPMLLAGVVLAMLLVQKEQQATEESLQEAAQLLSYAADAELRRSFAALETLAASDSLRRGDLKAFYAEAGRVREKLGLWDNLLLLSPSAEHLLNLLRPYGAPLPPVPQPEGSLTAARTQRPYVSGVLKGRVETDWLTYIAYPVMHDGEVRYVIGATIGSDYWSRWLSERAPRDHVAALTDGGNLILARSQQPERFVGSAPPAWYREALAASPSGVKRGVGLSEPDVVAAFQRSSVSGWSASLATSGAVLDAPIRRTAWGVGLAVAAALAIAVILALRRAAVLRHGIHTLREAVEGLKTARRPPPLRTPVDEIRAAMAAAEDTAAALAARDEALREADRRKDEFLATLSHELRGPLAPMVNALHLIKASGGREPATGEARQMMERQLRHLVRLVDDLLDVSRISRGRLELHREPVDVARVVEQALEIVRPHIGQDLELSLPAAPLYVEADRVRLAQVVANLLHNAAKYTPLPGSIRVSARAEGGEAVIRVRDSGIGIAAEELPRLFRMFAQARPALERAQGGLGIGLALARWLVELHGGTIEAHSEGPGKGAEFTVRLPATARQAGR
jgi:signal transduction histidine kinase